MDRWRGTSRCRGDDEVASGGETKVLAPTPDVEVTIDETDVKAGERPARQTGDDVTAFVEQAFVAGTGEEPPLSFPLDDTALVRAPRGHAGEALSSVHDPHGLVLHQGELPAAWR